MIWLLAKKPKMSTCGTVYTGIYHYTHSMQPIWQACKPTSMGSALIKNVYFSTLIWICKNPCLENFLSVLFLLFLCIHDYNLYKFRNYFLLLTVRLSQHCHQYIPPIWLYNHHQEIICSQWGLSWYTIILETKTFSPQRTLYSKFDLLKRSCVIFPQIINTKKVSLKPCTWLHVQ